MVKNYNIVEGRNAPIKTWSRGVPFDEKTIGQLQNLATLPHLQMGGGYAGCSLGYGIDCWFGDSYKRRDHSGGSRRRYWLRHGGSANKFDGERSTGRSETLADRNRGRRSTRPDRQRWP